MSGLALASAGRVGEHGQGGEAQVAVADGHQVYVHRGAAAVRQPHRAVRRVALAVLVVHVDGGARPGPDGAGGAAAVERNGGHGRPTREGEGVGAGALQRDERGLAVVCVRVSVRVGV